ncbi:DUF551 domain-containing protein [Enterobacter bugandensis]|uniref:DUF551 domain-containing protein n=1 Tax=Enterobacter bugandensis TaxID=881260 RepID=UPI001CC25204|nr:DUF551 domain-containing protein [Enterobacter bugandensis]
MSTITKEQLRERAREKVMGLELAVTQTAFADSRAELEEELELARIALASLEATPVAWRNKDSGHCGTVHIQGKSPIDCGYEPLYLAPPAPVSVPYDVMAAIQKVARIRLDLNDFDGDRRGIAESLGEAEEALIEAVTRRAAMLQGANGKTDEGIFVSKSSEMAVSNITIDESRCRNSPVIPDGWVACSERMPDNGGKSRELYLCWGTFFDGAEPDYIPAWFFIHPTNGWCEWQPMEDDCVPEQVTITHWQPLPAAPQQEVKL